MERIVCAANKVSGCSEFGVNGIYAGVRHANCFSAMTKAREGFVKYYSNDPQTSAEQSDKLRVDMLQHTTQGFLTNLNRFVDREEALIIAAAAGQIVQKHNPQDELHSEDLY